MTPALITLSFAISILVLVLAGKLFLRSAARGLEKLAIVIFLGLFSFQTLLLVFQLNAWGSLPQEIRPYLAALLAPCCFWALTLLARKEGTFKLIDLAHMLPFAFNALEVISFDYSLIGIQLLYAGLMINLVFDPRLNKRGPLKVTVLLLALLFAAFAVSDLLIAIETESGSELGESMFLFVSLFMIYSLLVFLTAVAQVNPSLIQQILSDIQFIANKPLLRESNKTAGEVSVQFQSIEKALKTHEYYLEEGFDLGYLAECLGLSTRNLSTIINQAAHKNFSAYINDLKIDKAKTLLTDPTSERLSVTQIMFDSGFVTKSSFNREFSSRTHMSPSQYRKSAAQKNEERRDKPK